MKNDRTIADWKGPYDNSSAETHWRHHQYIMDRQSGHTAHHDQNHFDFSPRPRGIDPVPKRLRRLLLLTCGAAAFGWISIYIFMGYRGEKLKRELVERSSKVTNSLPVRTF